MTRRGLRWASRLVAVLVVLLAGCSSTTAGSRSTRSSHSRHNHHAQSATIGPAPAAATGPTTYPPTRCPATTVAVHDARGLRAALSTANPGQVVGLAAGTYAGRFTAKAVAAAAKPIFLCGVQPR